MTWCVVFARIWNKKQVPRDLLLLLAYSLQNGVLALEYNAEKYVCGFLGLKEIMHILFLFLSFILFCVYSY